MRSLLISLVATLTMALVATVLDSSRPTDPETVAHIVVGMEDLAQRTSALLDRTVSEGTQLSDLTDLWDQSNMGLVIYDNGKATAWTTCMIPFPVTFGPRDRPTDGIVRLRNGHYVCRTVEQDGQLLVAYALVRTDLGFENRHVRNQWNVGMGVDARHRLTFSDNGTHALPFTSEGSTLHVRLADGHTPDPVVTLLWGLALLTLLVGLWKAGYLLEQRHGALLSTGVTFAALFLMRLVMMLAGIPEALHATELFGPGQYAASQLLPSLGDLLLDSVCMLLVVGRLQRVRITVPAAQRFGWLPMLAAQMLVLPVHAMLRSLVEDAAFPLDLNMPFALTWYSMVGLAVSFMVLTCHLMLLRWLLRMAVASSGPWMLAVQWVATLAVTALTVMNDGHALIAVCTGGVLVGTLLLGLRLRPGMRPSTVLAPTVLLFTLFATVVLQTELHRNEHLEREALARRLDVQQDPITEYLFKELEATLRSDRELRNALALLPDETEPALNRLQRRLRGEHWNRYRATVLLYSEEGRALASDASGPARPLEAMEQVFAEARHTLSDRLRFASDGNGTQGYLGRLVLEGNRNQPDIILFILLEQMAGDAPEGFTDLFIDEGISLTRALEGYSFARYREGELRHRSGPFAFPIHIDRLGATPMGFSCIVHEGYDHLIYTPVEGSSVVLSRPIQHLLGHLTIFSYLFLFYFGCALLLSMMTGRLNAAALMNGSFRNRINLAMAGMMTASLLVIGLLTVYHLINGYNDRHRANITEKTRSVLVELEHKLSARDRLDIGDRPALFPILSKFSKVFFTDINLYGLDGRLLSSSRPRVFREGLMAQMMDPVAYEEMRFGLRSSYIHSERIGRLEYQSAYVPFRNAGGEVIAYLSLPYFGRQYGLQQEILSLLAPLINIYVLLLLLSVMLALFISNRMTEPLRTVSDGLRNLRLEGGNRTIRWESDDEIGELVREYNRTLEELVRSAERLARSERESAWREMAKQVAHEIKNPLTPMKLSIQMLERSYRDGVPDLGERIERMSRTLIEQIDTLSHIASEFSNFAQMPRPESEDFDLRELLMNVAELNQGQGADIVTRLPESGPCTVHADREQMLRVFNNLVRNALQAIPENRRGHIAIGLEADENVWRASVSDNGTGITEELRDRVFVPNFTTKSGGMGLGLAMAKRMVEQFDGEIGFTSKQGVGTVFTVTLPNRTAGL